MKFLLFYLILIPSSAFCAINSLSPDIQNRLSAFVNPLKTEFGKYNTEKAWAELQVEGKETERKKLQEILKKNGSVIDMTLIKRRDSVGSKIITIEERLKFKSGHINKMIFVFIKRLNTPYELYDVSVN
jgi:hypothetical protein